MKANKLITELRALILDALQNVNDSNCPKVNKLLLDKEGYEWVEKQIINMVIDTGQAPEMCIPQIESEL